jgi:hypothetical protein
MGSAFRSTNPPSEETLAPRLAFTPLDSVVCSDETMGEFDRMPVPAGEM